MVVERSTGQCVDCAKYRRVTKRVPCATLASERASTKTTTASSDTTTLPSACRVSISHSTLSTVMFCSHASRFRNTSEHEWLSEGVQESMLFVLNIGVRPRDRHVQEWRASEGAVTKQILQDADTTTLPSACMVSISH